MYDAADFPLEATCKHELAVNSGVVVSEMYSTVAISLTFQYTF